MSNIRKQRGYADLVAEQYKKDIKKRHIEIAPLVADAAQRELVIDMDKANLLLRVSTVMFVAEDPNEADLAWVKDWCDDIILEAEKTGNSVDKHLKIRAYAIEILVKNGSKYAPAFEKEIDDPNVPWIY